MSNEQTFTLSHPTFFNKVQSSFLYSKNYLNRRLISPLDATQNKILNQLKEEGTVILEGYIDEAPLHQLQNELQNQLEATHFTTPCLAQSRIDKKKHQTLINNHLFGSMDELEKQGVTFSKTEVRDYQQVIKDFSPSSLTVKMLEYSKLYQQTWLDPYLLNIIARYMGMTPYLAEAYVRRNFPAKYRSMNHYWHRDLNNKFHLLKMFIFLSDCDLNTGPHEFIRGSHLKFDEFNGQRYFSDEAIEKQYPKNSKQRMLSTVKAGTVVIEDTRGLHRANIPKQAYRDLGFAVFMPLRPFYSYQNFKIKKHDVNELNTLQKAFIPASCLI